MTDDELPGENASENSGSPHASGGANDLMIIPAPAGAVAVEVSADFDEPASGNPDQLGFHLRFEGGRALLALENVVVAKGVEIKRALFEVPDVEFPLDVTGGALKFQKSRLTLRAIELALKYERMLQAEALKKSGLELIRERTRSGTIELLVSVEGAAEPVPIRAQGLFVPVGDAGVAIVLHEVVPFGPSPRPRAQLAEMILSGLDLPGGHPPRGMVRRAEPFRTTLSRLLPAFGWKVPAMGDVRVEEVLLKKSEVTFRAWSGEIPDGWKRPKKLRRAPIKDAVALAVFADELAKCADDEARIAVVDRLIDLGAVPAAVVPFAAEVLRTDPRRRSEGNALVETALKTHPDHLGVLSAHVDDESVAPAVLAARLATLGEAADLRDEAWVSARAYWAAARRYLDADEKEQARIAAEAGFAADPTLAPVGRLLSSLLRSKDPARALSVGRAALERTTAIDDIEAFATELAPLARTVEGASAARALLERALRKRDRAETLGALIGLEIEEGQLARAAELLARLLLASESPATTIEARADVQLLAARLSRAQGDDESARMHLASAQSLLPSHVGIALQLAELHRDRGDLDSAIESLAGHIDDDSANDDALTLAAGLRIARANAHDADKALGLLERISDDVRTGVHARLIAEANALRGQPAALVRLLREDAERAHDVADKGAALSRAAQLCARDGGVDETTEILAALLASGAPGAADLAATAMLSAADPSALTAGIVATNAIDVADSDAIASALADAGRPLDALALMRRFDDDDHLLMRAELARQGGAVEDEILAVRAWTEGRSGEGVAEAWVRVGALHLARHQAQSNRAEALAAVDAWAQSIAHGGDDAEGWLAAAVAAEDNERLVPVLLRDDVGLERVPTDALRTASQSLVHLCRESDDPGLKEVTATAARRALAEVATRKELQNDVETYLEFAKETLPPRVAADVYARYADLHQRPQWALFAAQLEEEAGAPGAALARLLEAAEGPLGEDVALTERAFEIACERGHLAGIERATDLLIAHHPSPSDRAVVFGLAADALSHLDKEAWERMIVRRLDADPGAERALVDLAPVWMERGELSIAVERFAAFLEVNSASERIVDAIADVAVIAQESGDAETERVARKQLAAARTNDDVRKPADLMRLAQLQRDVEDFEGAVESLERRVSLEGDVEELRAAYVQIAELCHAALDRPEDAAVALRHALAVAPDDIEVSETLLSLLNDAKDFTSVASELGRRLSRETNRETLGALRLRQGDAFDAAKMPRQAERVWLTALRTPPFQRAVFDRLENRVAHEAMPHRLDVRRHLAASRALVDDVVAAEHAAEAGAILAGVLQKNLLALAAYRSAERRGDDEQKTAAISAQLEIFRAENMADEALAAIARLSPRVDDHARALLLESKAEVLESSEGDVDGALAARREALALDPTLRASAHKLERTLRDAGEFREAIAVRRRFVDEVSTGVEKAQAYADLAEEAIEYLQDDSLAIELGAVAIGDAPQLNRLRLMLVDALVREGQVAAACDHLNWLLEVGNLDEGDRVPLARRKANLEATTLHEPQAARRTLRQELAKSPSSDTLIRDLVTLEEEMGEVAAAAEALRAILREKPNGTEILGSRREVLEWMGRLEEEAEDHVTAQDTLSEAAALGRLSQGSALRWARLCEAAGDFDNAVAALDMLTSSPDLAPEEHIAALGRLALNAERAGQPERALDAWSARSERIPNDTDALRAVERLAISLDRLETARKAASTLLHQEAGDVEEQARRTTFVARDERDRLQDASSALKWFATARELSDTEDLRRETWECAELAGDDAVVFAVVDAMWAAGDAVGSEELTRRAETGLSIGQTPEHILKDALDAADLENAVSPRLAAVFDRLGEMSPTTVAEAYLDRKAGDVTSSALRAALRSPEALPAQLLGHLADAHPSDRDFVRAAALADAEVESGGKAADRLLALAEASGDDEDYERAADVLLRGADFSALLGRLEALESTLAQSTERRQQALTILRDQEAWGPVASLLEASLEFVDGPEADRTIRMELVSVLRSGVEDEERAAQHLEVLVARDPNDREAWGDLLEAYESLNDGRRLADALGRRIDRTAGLERRELVRRRATLLLDVGEGAQVLSQLQQTREEFPHDDTLKVLEQGVHAESGDAALCAFHAAELRRGGGIGDARALIALGELVPLEVRVLARAEILRSDRDAAGDAARALVAVPDEFARVASAIDDDARVRLFTEAVAALGRDAPKALRLVDAVRTAGVREPLEFAVAAAAWRLRAEGAVRARGDVQRIPDEAVRAAATVHTARRANEPDRVRGALQAAGASPEMMNAFDAALSLRKPSVASLVARANAAIVDGLTPLTIAIAAMRLEDRAAFEGALRQLGDDDKATLAQRAQCLRLSEIRAPWMLLLAHHLDTETRHARWNALAAFGVSSSRTDLASDAFDALRAEDALDAAGAQVRAEIAEARDDDNVAEILMFAADKIDAVGGDASMATSMRRRAIDRLVRAQDRPALRTAINAFVGAGTDPAVVTEALQLSRAARVHDVTDHLFSLQIENAVDTYAAREAILAQVAHRRHAMRDPKAAFEALSGAATRWPAVESFVDDAYALATAEGMVEESLVVVVDPLAKAGLLAALGRFSAALDAAAAIEGRGARVLEAEILRAQGAVEEHRIALEVMAEDVGFGPGPRERLLEAALERGAADDALRYAMSLVETEGADAHLVSAVRTASSAASDGAAAQAAERLRAVLASGGIAVEQELHLLDAWADCALRTGRDDDVIDARYSIAKRRGEDADWSAWLDVALPRRGPAAIVVDLEPVLARPAVLAAGFQTHPVEMEAVFRHLVIFDSTLVAQALKPLSPTPVIRGLRIDAHEAAGQHAEAAALILDAAQSMSDASTRNAALLRAASAYLLADAPEEAQAVLLGFPLDAFDRHAREVVLDVKDRSSQPLALLARLVAANAATSNDLDSAYQLAAEADDATAHAFAALCLRRDRRDFRAVALVASRPDPVPYFSAATALQSGRLATLSEPARDALGRDVAAVEAILAPPAVAVPAASTPLERARQGTLAERAVAWKGLAEEAASAGDAVLSARLLARSGISIEDAPIEIRLIADSSLTDKVMRAAAIAAAVSAMMTESDVDTMRAETLADQFDGLNRAGYARPEHRIMMRAYDAREGQPAFVPTLSTLLDDVEGGEGAQWSTLLGSLGRHPSPSERATVAAIAGRTGHAELAAALHPGVVSQAAAAPAVEAPVDFLARAGEARLRGLPLEAAGLVRLHIGAHGSTPQVELQFRELATQGARFDLVSESLGRQAGGATDAAEASALLMSRAELHQSALEDAEGAMVLARLATERLPANRPAAALWASLANALERHAEHVEALAFIEMGTEGAQESLTLVLQRAALLREKIGDSAQALRVAEAGGREYGETSELFEEIGRCHQAQGAFAKAGHALVASATSLDRAVPRRLELLREGALMLLGADALEAGLDALIVAARAGDVEALDILEDRARGAGANEALAEALRLRLAKTDDVAARRVISMELATHLSDVLLRRGEARETLERQAVEDESDFRARVVLAQWYLDERRTLDAALAYESAAMVPDVEDSARAPAAQNAAILLSALGDLERAGPLAESAIVSGAVNEQTLAVAIAFHHAHQNLAEVDALLGRQVELAETAREASYVWMERARIRVELGDDDGARVALSRVLENRPDHFEALEGLRADAIARDNYGTFRAALSRAAELGDDRDQRVAWLVEIAHLDAEKFDDLRAGLATLDRAIALAPEDPAVLLAKADFMVRGGDVEGLPTLLDQAVALGAVAVPGHLELKRGDALLIAGDRAAAMSAFERATAVEDVARAAWDRVIDLAEGLGDDDRLVLALRNARLAAEDAERAALFGRKEARLRTKQGDEDGAADAWKVVLDINPGDTEGLRALRDHFARKRKLDQFEPLIEAWALWPDDTAEKARRLSELGAFLLDEVGAESRAKSAFERALEFEPREQNALIRLAQVGYAAQDWARTSELLDLIVPDQWPRGSIAFAFAQAECAAHLNSVDADTRLQVVLQQDPKHIPALELVAKRAQADGRTDDAEHALEMLATVVSANEDPVRVANVCADLAQLRLGQGRGDDAKVAAERALELHPTSRKILSIAADARAAAADPAGAAQLLGSLAAVTEEGEERIALMGRRAGLLQDAEMTHEAAELFAFLAETTDDKDYRRQAIDLAMDLGDIILLERLGIDARPGDTNPGFHVLGQKAQSLLDEGRPTEALEVLEEAFREGQGDAELARVGVLAAKDSGTAEQRVFFLTERLPHLTDPKEKLDAALMAGRLLRDELDSPEKAAEMLYVAHQCAPENLELRLELTSLYARLPRLIAHAQTGVLQLIRRAPTDARAYQVATRVAMAQSRADKKGAMIAASLLLDGKSLTPEVAPPGPLLPDPNIPLLAQVTTSVLAPKEFAKGRTFGTLVALLGSPLESEFVDHSGVLATAERLLEARPDADRYLERIDRLLPGRPVKFLLGDVPVLTFHPGAVLHAILPRHVLRFGDAVLVAFVARAYAVARLGGVIPETLDPEDMGEVRRLLEAAFLGKSPDEGTKRKAERLLERVPDDLKGAASNGARVALPENPGGEAQAFGEGIRTIADRFGLLVSGSLPGTLAAGALPEVLTATPSATAAALVASPRALDLCRFSARDDVWDLRRTHRLIID